MNAVEGGALSLGDVLRYLEGVEAIVVEKAVSREGSDVLPRDSEVKSQDEEQGTDHEYRTMSFEHENSTR
jgi:hypothetical protein